MKRWLLWFVVLAPVFYYVALIGGASTWPGYSHVTQYASELGAAGAPYPELFNYNIIAAGVAAMLGSAGLGSVLRDQAGGWLWAAPAAVALALWGAGMVMGGMYPMPDERHGGFGLAMAGQLTPLFVLLALRNAPASQTVRLLAGLVFVVSGALFAVMMGVGGLVTLANVGIWQRAYSFASIAWLAPLGLGLLARLPDANAERRRRAGVSLL